MSNPYPQRIVCLTEEPTEVLYALGEQDRIDGLDAIHQIIGVGPSAVISSAPPGDEVGPYALVVSLCYLDIVNIGHGQ